MIEEAWLQVDYGGGGNWEESEAVTIEGGWRSNDDLVGQMVG
jgi:hypothetical protein